MATDDHAVMMERGFGGGGGITGQLQLSGVSEPVNPSPSMLQRRLPPSLRPCADCCAATAGFLRRRCTRGSRRWRSSDPGANGARCCSPRLCRLCASHALRQAQNTRPCAVARAQYNAHSERRAHHTGEHAFALFATHYNARLCMHVPSTRFLSRLLFKRRGARGVGTRTGCGRVAAEGCACAFPTSHSRHQQTTPQVYELRICQ